MHPLQVRPEPDQVMQDIADYVHNYEVSHARTLGRRGERESSHRPAHARRSSRTSRTTRRASA